MALLKGISRAPWMQAVLGFGTAEYLRLVWHTSRFVVEPPDLEERLRRDFPFIAAFWHGQHYMMPFTRPDFCRVKCLISRHRDGEVNAVAAERLGIATIRGSGDHERRFDRKGGVAAFKSMLTALKNDWTMALTADIPKVSRVAGDGIVKLARVSGRPIYPFAVATSRRVTLSSWDRSVINLPFSRGAIVVGEPIEVAADADAEALERARSLVEERLNAATERAYAIVDKRDRDRG